MKKAIAQEHGTGCGVSCVAFVLGKSYQGALKLFGRPKNATTCGYSCRDIVTALSKGGRDYSYSYLKPSKNTF